MPNNSAAAPLNAPSEVTEGPPDYPEGMIPALGLLITLTTAIIMILIFHTPNNQEVWNFTGTSSSFVPTAPPPKKMDRKLGFDYTLIKSQILIRLIYVA